MEELKNVNSAQEFQNILNPYLSGNQMNLGLYGSSIQFSNDDLILIKNYVLNFDSNNRYQLIQYAKFSIQSAGITHSQLVPFRINVVPNLGEQTKD
jgi:hypothetical protein